MRRDLGTREGFDQLANLRQLRDQLSQLTPSLRGLTVLHKDPRHRERLRQIVAKLIDGSDCSFVLKHSRKLGGCSLEVVLLVGRFERGCRPLESSSNVVRSAHSSTSSVDRALQHGTDLASELVESVQRHRQLSVAAQVGRNDRRDAGICARQTVAQPVLGSGLVHVPCARRVQRLSIDARRCLTAYGLGWCPVGRERCRREQRRKRVQLGRLRHRRGLWREAERCRLEVDFANRERGLQAYHTNERVAAV